MFGPEFTTVILYNEASHKKQKKSYEERKAKIWEKLEDLKRRLESNRGKERDKSSVEREFNDIIHKDFRSVIGHKVGEIPKGKKKPNLEIWIKKEVEELRYAGFGKTIVFTDMQTWHSEKIAKTYNQKYLVEDDFKLLNDVLLVPVGPINRHKDFNIRAHIFLCVIGMIFYRYLAWKCKHLRLSFRRLVEELGGICLALVQGKTGGKGKVNLLDLGKFIGK